MSVQVSTKNICEISNFISSEKLNKFRMSSATILNGALES